VRELRGHTHTVFSAQALTQIIGPQSKSVNTSQTPRTTGKVCTCPSFR